MYIKFFCKRIKLNLLPSLMYYETFRVPMSHVRSKYDSYSLLDELILILHAARIKTLIYVKKIT